MNVLLTTDVFPPRAGGSGRSTAVLARALVKRGHRVRVVTARTESVGLKEWNEVEVEEVELSRDANRERAFAEGIRRGAGEEAWDLVHAQHFLSAGASRRALPRLPLVVTVRDYWPVCIWSTMLSGSVPCPGCSYGRRVVCVGRRHPWLWPIAPVLPPYVENELRKRRRALEEARSVIAVSAHVARTLPVASATVVPNVVDSFPEDIPRPPEVPERYVLFVGKLEPNKAPDRLDAILDAARCELPLLVAGTGSMEKELRRRARRDTVFLGWVEEARALALMKHASALVFPSRWQEPLSRVLLDALALGAVIVVEPTGGSGEIVVCGESGLCGSTVEELGQALRRVLADEALASRLRAGARERARALFSEEAVLPRIESIYASVTAS